MESLKVGLAKMIVDCVKNGKLDQPFTPAQVKNAIPGYSSSVYYDCLSKYSKDSVGEDLPLFIKISDGHYVVDLQGAEKFAQQSTPAQVIDYGELRDQFFAFTVMLYVFGYTVWSIFAWVNNLDLLPLLDAQYFVAGIIPLLTTLSIYKYKEIFVDPVSIVSLNLGDRSKLVLAIAIAIVLLLSIYRTIYVLFVADINSSFIPIMTRLILAVFVCLIILDSIFGMSQRNKRYVIFRKISLVVCYVFALYYYSEVIFPKLPYQVGGPEYRCASLSITEADIPKSLERILIDDIVYRVRNHSKDVIQTEELQVVFTGSDFWLIIPQNYGRLVEIKKDNIKAVQWCN